MQVGDERQRCENVRLKCGSGFQVSTHSKGDFSTSNRNNINN